MHWIDVFTKFQTVIVGVLGFTGVIVTLIVNAQLARSARAAAIKHERETLIAGLIVEFEVCLVGFEKTWNHVNNPREEVTYNFPIYKVSPIFEANLEKIGLLEANTLKLVFESYLGMEQFRNVALMNGVLVNEGRSVAILGSNLIKMAPDYPRFLGVIKSAIEALKKEADALL